MNIALQISVASGMKDYRKKLEDMNWTRVLLGEENVISLFDKLLVEPLNAISQNKEMEPKAILIDALDECIHNDNNGILNCISKDFVKLPSWIKVMVTTRPEVPIMNKLKRLKPTLLEPLGEKNLNDLNLFFQHALSEKIKSKDVEYFKKITGIKEVKELNNTNVSLDAKSVGKATGIDYHAIEKLIEKINYSIDKNKKIMFLSGGCISGYSNSRSLNSLVYGLNYLTNSLVVSRTS